MAKIAKLILILIGALAGLLVVGAVALTLFFDPNDYRDEFSTQVRQATGREFVIEGDVSISVFPWLAIEVGHTTLGNAEGFGDEPFLSFDNARLSVEFMPLVLRQEISVGMISLEGFVANLVVASDGSNNWDDLASAADDAPAQEATSDKPDATLDIANIRLDNANLSYRDNQSGSSYALSDLNIGTGRISAGEPFDFDASFRLSATPGDLGGDLSIRGSVTLAENMQQLSIVGLNVSGELTGIVAEPTTFNLDARAIILDLAGQRLTLGETDLAILGISMAANVEPFSFAGDPVITTTLRVAEFSLKELLQTLDIDAPVTADPNALTTISFSGQARIDSQKMTLSDMRLVLDDTTMTGELVVPLNESGSLEFDLAADSINLDNYMAPADESSEDADDTGSSDVEIPVELIRVLKASGSIRLDEAFLGPMTFTNLQLGIESANEKLRLHPITAEFFEGTYNGDVRIDVSGATPTLTVNERISDVNLQAMARTVFEAENISGMINARFALGGTGTTMSQIQRSLNGTMDFTLTDGAVEGIDVWHQLRTARALYKREEAPEAVLPARTDFTAIKATGTVTEGVFLNDDLLVEMPFMRITGNGTINLGSSEIDYSVQARILENPELMNDVSQDELADFTEVLIPIKIRGTLDAPSFRPDIEVMFRREVEKAIKDKAEELKQDLLNKLLGGQPREDRASGEVAGESAGDSAHEEPKEEEKLEDQLKNALKDLFKN